MSYSSIIRLERQFCIHDTFEMSGDKPREKWSRKIEFLFACIGFAVGYGNFWRFPFKCFKNGGGAFLIPFIICLVFTGIPLFMLELSLGQSSQAGPLKTFKKIAPVFAGIGHAMIVLCFLVSVYYNVILAWSFYYFFNSFQSKLPWVGCDHQWVSSYCYDPFMKNINATNATMVNSNSTSPSREFFTNNVLQISSGLYDTGSMNWKPLGCLLLAWICVYFCIWKGIRTTGKVVYVTATLPYVMLFVFFVRGITLPGAVNGISYYVTPEWDKLLVFQVWVDAASQVFYSLTLGFGVMLTFASYNDRSNNLFRDALLISIVDALTSIFSGFVVFAIMGYMAEIQQKDITDPAIATDGPGLVFIVYPAALATLPQPQMWSVIFFLMLITLGLDSQFGQVEAVSSSLIEQFPRQLEKYKELVVLGVCVLLFLLGLPCMTQGGMYWFNLIDNYSAGLSLLFIGFFELIAVAWIYGANEFRANIEKMIGFKISYGWVIMWKYITPIIVAVIFLFGLIKHSRLKYETFYTYPASGELLGWLMAIASMIWIPIIAVKEYIQAEGCATQKFQFLLKSNKSKNYTEKQEGSGILLK